MWRKKSDMWFSHFHGQPHTPGRGKNPEFFVGSGEVFVFGFLFYLNIYSSLSAFHIPLPASLFGNVENLMASCRESLRF